MSRTHYIKIAPKYFSDMESGDKPFEVRRNDRDYQVGDTLVLQEWLPGVEYTGREIVRRVAYVLHGGVFGIADGYCVMGMADGWIPVSERLPTAEDADENGEIMVLESGGRKGICTPKDIEDFYVTHWMPLPSTEGLRNEA